MCSIRNCAQPLLSLFFALFSLTLTAEDLLADVGFLWYTGNTDGELNSYNFWFDENLLETGKSKLKEQNTVKKNSNKDANDSVALGIGLGLIFGLMFDNLALGLLVGIAVGGLTKMKK